MEEIAEAQSKWILTQWEWQASITAELLKYWNKGPPRGIQRYTKWEYNIKEYLEC